MSMDSNAYSGIDSSARKLANEGRSAMDRVEEAVPRVRERVENLVETGRERVRDFQREIQDDIREKPVQSFLIAAGIGAVIGLFLGRSRH